MQVKIIGCGEAFDDQLGNSSLLVSSSKGTRVLVDCGYQIPERLWRLKLNERDIDAVALTHLHADHSFGLPALLVRMKNEGRRRPLTILAQSGAERFLFRLMSLGYPGLYKHLGFEIRYRPISPQSPTSYGEFSFRAARTRHSVLNYTLRIDHTNGASLAVSGDGEPTRASLALIRGCDLWVQEVYWFKPAGTGHQDWQTLLKQSRSANARKIVVWHTSLADRAKIQRAVQGAVSDSVEWIWARPGLSLKVVP